MNIKIDVLRFLYNFGLTIFDWNAKFLKMYIDLNLDPTRNLNTRALMQKDQKNSIFSMGQI